MELREAVRKRPGMYVGGTDGFGVAQLVLEVLSNAVDQHLVGRCHRIDLRVDADGSVTIDDDGPGIRTGAVDGMPPLVERLTKNPQRPTADGHRPHVHVGRLGAGLSVVNVLCERFELMTVREGIESSVAFEQGILVSPLDERAVKRASGTRVRFRADPAIFDDTYPEMQVVSSRIDDLSFVAPRLAIGVSRAGVPLAGIVERVEKLQRRGTIGPVAHHRGRYGNELVPIDVEIALSWSDVSHEPAILSFVNLERTHEHGQHVLGMRDALRAGFGRARWEVVARGLLAVVSVVLDDVILGSPTRERLDSPASRPAVAAAAHAVMASRLQRLSARQV
ncbi:MAG: hypothetical protein K8M05_41870 [Deltaproteobacteria bacterium]|nr:hypothetical protein [Kofleriaceae bacterium]